MIQGFDGTLITKEAFEAMSPEDRHFFLTGN